MIAKKRVETPFKAVKLGSGFWGKLVDRTIKSTLPHVLQKCEEEGHINNIRIAAGLSTDEYSGGADRDSDLFKVLEGAAYGVAIEENADLDTRLEELVGVIAAAQQADGYIQSFITSQTPDKRYDDLERSHELYCAGHLIEAAVAHFEATGRTSFLDIATRFADHMDATFGYGKREMAPGHQGVELALVRLYDVTGEKRYLDLGRFFVDMRGDKERVERDYSGKLIIESDRTPGRNRPPEYRQDHLPILEQTFATGHAVRAGYTYAALADVALAYDSEPHAKAAEAIWENVVSKKLYLTGGVGTHQYHDEGYGDDYLLPNTGYCETCGGIAFLLFSHRMGLLTGESKYADIVETILYNHLLSSTDLSGCNTFYRNPLSAQGPRKRHPWNYPACCPTNVVRMIPQVVTYLYGKNENSIFIDQFATSESRFELNSANVTLRQETDYPWDGKVTVKVDPGDPSTFALHIRVPGWVDGNPVPSDLYSSVGSEGNVAIAVNGECIDATERKKGYCVIERAWDKDDVVEINFPMPILRVHAHESVEADRGRVALMRGPLVYCFEESDSCTEPEELVLSSSAQLNTKAMPETLGGIVAITHESKSLTAIPFNVWNNREPGKMAVWVKETD